jgi:hypothetical protein
MRSNESMIRIARHGWWTIDLLSYTKDMPHGD